MAVKCYMIKKRMFTTRVSWPLFFSLSITARSFRDATHRNAKPTHGRGKCGKPPECDRTRLESRTCGVSATADFAAMHAHAVSVRTHEHARERPSRAHYAILCTQRRTRNPDDERGTIPLKGHTAKSYRDRASRASCIATITAAEERETPQHRPRRYLRGATRKHVAR